MSIDLRVVPIQDLYPDDFAYCYGCGRHNEHGLHIQTFWDGEVGTARIQPRPYHIAVPGFVYGGLLASLIDCHSIGTAAAAWAEAHGVDLEHEPAPRFVTASLKVDYLKPTPLGPTLVLRSRPVEIGARKVIVETDLRPEGAAEPTVRGHTVAVLIPDNMRRGAQHRAG